MPKAKSCKVCTTPFTPTQPLQRVCGVPCAIKFNNQLDAKKARKVQRARRAAIKPRAAHMRECQAAFNAWVRYRDRDLPCVSCNRHHEGQYHAGHYRTTASQSALRFNEINCHKQCAPCNNNLSGDIIRFRQELIRRVGPELVDWLEIDHPKTKPWTIEELNALRRYYVKAKKDMEKWNEAQCAVQ